MRRPLVKICGLTQPQDVRQAITAGADLVGLNFVASSPRAVSFAQAEHLAAVARATPRTRHPDRPARVVAVFVDPDEELVLGVLDHVRPDILQFHGEEPAAFCRLFRKPFVKAFQLRGKADVDAIDAYLGGYAVGYLIDAFSPTQRGGTGRRLSIELARYALARPRGFLAGGLTPANVGDAVARLRPFGVDVASGVELRAGIKSGELMVDFVRQVDAACRDAG